MSYTITLDNGKYTIINHGNAPLEFRRYGEAWPAADDLRHANVVRAMADRIEELETAIATVLRGTTCPWGRMDDGMDRGGGDPVMVQHWARQLRNALEQK